MTSSSQVITEYGKQNIFARETPPQLVENYTNHPKEAEKNQWPLGNGWHDQSFRCIHFYGPNYSWNFLKNNHEII